MARMMTHGELRRRRRRRWKQLGCFLLLLLAGTYAGWRVWIERVIDAQNAEPRRPLGPGGIPVRSEPEFGPAAAVAPVTNALPETFEPGTQPLSPVPFEPNGLTNAAGPVLPKPVR